MTDKAYKVVGLIILFTIASIISSRAETILITDEPMYIYSGEPATATRRGVEEPQAVYSSIHMTEEEERLLEAILWGEANNQSLKGQMAVIEVVFNRVLSKEWPDTVYGVLSQKGQFATWKSRNKIHPNEMQSDAISEVLRETETIIPRDYVFFARKRRGWMNDCFKLEDHWFGR